MLKQKTFTILFFLFSISSYSFYELDFDFGYTKKVYGEARENKNTARVYSGSLAIYFASSTALEFNYSNQRERSLQVLNQIIDVPSNTTYLKDDASIQTNVYGVGFRHALGKRKARFLPTISLGYAKQFISNNRTADLDRNGVFESIVFTESKTREDSVFATFALRYRLTKAFSLKASANTIFPAFEFSQIKDYLKYTVGFTWYF